MGSKIVLLVVSPLVVEEMMMEKKVQFEFNLNFSF